MKILSFLGNILDRLCVLGGAFIGSQIPAFMQQYIQRLSGHVDELQHVIRHLEFAAAHSGKTLEQYIQKFLSSVDIDFIHQGEFMQKTLVRWEELNLTLYHLTHSSLWVRPYLFLKELQYDIAQSVLASFQSSLNLNPEGLCYAGTGMLIGWLFFKALSNGFHFSYLQTQGVLRNTFKS